MSIALPGDYVVWATGDLMNKDSVYTPEIGQRLDRAEKSDSITDISVTVDPATGRRSRVDAVYNWRGRSTRNNPMNMI